MAVLIVAGSLGALGADGMPGSGSPSTQQGHAVLGGQSSSLREPTGPTAVFYGTGFCVPNQHCVPADWSCATPPCTLAPVPAAYAWDRNPGIPTTFPWGPVPAPGVTCLSSPSCIPTLPPTVSSAFFGTPTGPASQTGAHCAVIPSTLAPCYSTGYLPNPCAPAVDGDVGVSAIDQTPVKPTWSPIDSVWNSRTTNPNRYLAQHSISRTPFVPSAGYAPPQYTNPYNPSGIPGDGRFHLDSQYVVTEAFETANTTNPTPFVSNGDPAGAEGAPDQSFVILGHDGYILGRLETPLVDGDGYDLTVATIRDQPSLVGTFCVYGATSPQGPFTLVHSAFVRTSACDPGTSAYCPTLSPAAPSCPVNRYCWHFDLGFFYTPLRSAMGLPNPGGLEYVLVVNSLERTPYLKTEFSFVPDNSQACMAPATCPDDANAQWRSWYPSPLRNSTIGFDDASIRFGYPMWQRYDAMENPVYDMTNNRASRIAEWLWNFQGDPCSLPFNPSLRPGQEQPDDPVTTPPYYNTGPTVPFQNPPEELVDMAWGPSVMHRFTCPGIFPVCHAVAAEGQRLKPFGPAVVAPQVDPPRAGLLEGLEKGAAHCRKITIWNLPPNATFALEVQDDPVTYRFHDRSVDPDWRMEPRWDYSRPDWMVRAPWDYGLFHPSNPTVATGEEFGVCPTCPPDGIQFREFDFESDGNVDWRWEFYGRLVDEVDVRMDDRLYLPSTHPGPLFSPEDVGRHVRGHDIRLGTVVTEFVSDHELRLSLPTLNDGNSTRVVLFEPFDTGPHIRHTYPRPGTYHATYRVCDHDHRVLETEPLFGTRLLDGTRTAADLTVFMGDPLQVTWDPMNDDDPPFPRRGHSEHACDTRVREVRISNNPPHLCGIPPNIAVAVDASITFTVCAWDVDPGQTLTLRLCEGQALPSGVTFPTLGPVPLLRIEQEFRLDVAGWPPGRHGPICFEALDGFEVEAGVEAVRVHSTIWVVGDPAQDTDMDGVPDLSDNCPAVANRDQKDSERDGVGDACRHEVRGALVVLPVRLAPAGIDTDNDGVPDATDNCPGVANPAQGDMDNDGRGDLCDPDVDGDGVVNTTDNCPTAANPLQADADRDGWGDACGEPTELDRALRGLQQESSPQAAPAAWRGLALGIALGLVSMALVFVPLVHFSLRRANKD